MPKIIVTFNVDFLDDDLNDVPATPQMIKELEDSIQNWFECVDYYNFCDDLTEITSVPYNLKAEVLKDE